MKLMRVVPSESSASSTSRPGSRPAEVSALHSGATKWVMNDSCSLASCGCLRFMYGEIGKSRQLSSSPWQHIHQCHSASCHVVNFWCNENSMQSTWHTSIGPRQLKLHTSPTKDSSIKPFEMRNWLLIPASNQRHASWDSYFSRWFTVLHLLFLWLLLSNVGNC